MKNQDFWKGKKVLVTGVCGTVGSEILKQLSSIDDIDIIGLDNNETDLFFLNDRFKDSSNINFYLCDVANYDDLNIYFQGVNVVLHLAARKHVILCEMAPSEAIKTNIMGVQNIIKAANVNNVEHVLFTSSDKAVNPTNVMGTTKLMGERLITAANSNKKGQFPIFSSTRFGNVLGSNGSVIPIFTNQIINGAPITLTDEKMSRFIMTVEQAASLVLDSIVLSQGGEVFVTKMPVLKIKDLAKSLIELLSEKFGLNYEQQIKIIGAKPGEKLFEELINEEEVRRTIELNEFFVVLPALATKSDEYKDNYGVKMGLVTKTYRSDLEYSMKLNEIKKFLIQNNLV